MGNMKMGSAEYTIQRRQKQPRAAGAESWKRALSPYLGNKQKEIFNLVGEAI